MTRSLRSQAVPPKGGRERWERYQGRMAQNSWSAVINNVTIFKTVNLGHSSSCFLIWTWWMSARPVNFSRPVPTRSSSYSSTLTTMVSFLSPMVGYAGSIHLTLAKNATGIRSSGSSVSYPMNKLLAAVVSITSTMTSGICGIPFLHKLLRERCTSRGVGSSHIPFPASQDGPDERIAGASSIRLWSGG